MVNWTLRKRAPARLRKEHFHHGESKKRGLAARKTLIFILLLASAVALVLYLKSGGAAPTNESSAQIVINEVMISNKGAVPDETGPFPDWVEIYNNTDSSLDISGYGLSAICSPPPNGRSRKGPSFRAARLSCRVLQRGRDPRQDARGL
jgi:hypothetical protein